MSPRYRNKNQFVGYNAFGHRISRGFLINSENSEMITFQFNPPEWLEQHSAVYGSVDSPGTTYPEINYLRQNKRVIPLTIEIDGVGTGISCESKIQQLIELTKPTGNTIVKRGSRRFQEPPRCKFVWGDIVKKVVVSDVKVKRTQFDRRLNTTVATVDIEMIEFT